MIVLSVGAAAALTVYKADHLMRFLAGGTGLFGTPAHSTAGRSDRMFETLAVVRKSPFVGYSLGGVAAAIAESHGETVTTQEGAKNREAVSVFLEVLAASGVIGFVPFVAYILTLFIKPAGLARLSEDQYRAILTALLWALAMEFLVLQFNQNILRPYLWFHIAVLSATYAGLKDHLKTAPARRSGLKLHALGSKDLA